LEDFFGYDVNFVQNVTDIDDKIILRARQTYLFDKYCKENSESVNVNFVDLKIKPELIKFINKNLDLNIVTVEDYASWKQNTSKLKNLLSRSGDCGRFDRNFSNCIILLFWY